MEAETEFVFLNSCRYYLYWTLYLNIFTLPSLTPAVDNHDDCQFAEVFFRHYNNAEVHSSVTWDSLSLYLLSCKLWLVLVLAHPRFHLPGYYAGTWCWVPSLLWFIYIYVLLIYLLFHPYILCSPPPLLLLILFFRPIMHSLYCSNVMKEQEHRVFTGSSYWSWIVTVICSKLVKCDHNMTFRIKCWYWKHWYQCMKRGSSWNYVPEPYNRKVECSTLFASSSLCPSILGKVVCIMFSCSPITLVSFLCLY